MASNGPSLRKADAAAANPSPPSPEERRTKRERAEDAQGLKYGILVQVLRGLLLATWISGCCACICVTQLIGSPLYFINRNYFYAYMSWTKQSFGIVISAITQWGSPTIIRVSGDKSVRGQLRLTKDGRLQTNFADRQVLIANHQIYTDWIYLWWIAYTGRMHGHIYIILKESLKYIPIVGTGMMFYGFIFMARKWESDKPRLQHRLEKLKAKHTGPLSGPNQLDPMWLLLFPEGTNLSLNTKRRSDAWGERQGIPPLKHQVIPRSTGLFFCLQQLKGSVDWVYDCTIAYEGPPKGRYPDYYFTLRSTYVQGRPPKSVNMYWRRFAVSEMPLDDQKEFEAWLLQRWIEKDALLDQFHDTGKFPADESAVDATQSPASAGPGYLEAEVKLAHWLEIGQIFLVLALAVYLIQQITKLWG